MQACGSAGRGGVRFKLCFKLCSAACLADAGVDVSSISKDGTFQIDSRTRSLHCFMSQESDVGIFLVCCDIDFVYVHVA